MQTRETTRVRKKGDYEYNNGDPYTDWELLVDAPEIPASRSDAEPRHAVRGDVLRERYDDELTPFELRRGGRRIGDPEWWQVRHLFGDGGGTEAEEDASDTFMEKVNDDREAIIYEFVEDDWIGSDEVRAGTLLLYARKDCQWWMDARKAPHQGRDGLHRVYEQDAERTIERWTTSQVPRYMRALATLGLGDAAQPSGIAYVEEPVEALGLRPGDLLIQHEREYFLNRQAVYGVSGRGTLRELGLDDYETLRAVVDASPGRIVDISMNPYPWGDSVVGFIRCKNKWGRRLKVWHSRLLHLRLYNLHEPVSRPIQARSVDGAIFELLAQSRCRMPDPKRRERSRPGRPSAAALAAVFLTEFCTAGKPATITPEVFAALERLVKAEGIPEREVRALLTFAKCCVSDSVDRSIVQALRQAPQKGV